jgi:tRNA(fMet)-specific endonuclease VapC
MRYLIDTHAVIALARRRSASLVERVLATDEGEIGLSAIGLHELYYGADNSQRVSFNLETIRLLTQDFPIVPFEQSDAYATGEIRAALAEAGQTIGPFDVLIAGQAKARGLTVITNNLRQYLHIENLKVEDWTVG